MSIGRAEMERPPVAQSAQQLVGGLNLTANEGWPLKNQVSVIPGVVAELVATAVDLLDELWMGLGMLSDQEERGLGTVLFQKGEDLARGLGVGSVVEGQGKHLAGGPDLADGLTDDLRGTGSAQPKQTVPQPTQAKRHGGHDEPRLGPPRCG